MTPQEKAEELIGKFNYESKHFLMLYAKQCALITVDEILSIQVVKNGYWQEVKQEIEKLNI